jgi:hypothetical protein
MAREVLVASKENGEQARYLLEVFQEGDHWTSTLARLNARGQSEPSRVAPRFYGFTAEQARRRMIAVLENEWDEVVPVGET